METGGHEYRETENQGHWVTRDQGNREPGTLGEKEPRKQRTRDTGRQGTRETENQGHWETRNQGNREPGTLGNNGTRETENQGH